MTAKRTHQRRRKNEESRWRFLWCFLQRRQATRLRRTAWLYPIRPAWSAAGLDEAPPAFLEQVLGRLKAESSLVAMKVGCLRALEALRGGGGAAAVAASVGGGSCAGVLGGDA